MEKTIKDYYGKLVEIRCPERIIYGKLIYFHFDNQTITLNDVMIKTEAGDQEERDMMLINKDDWSTIKSMQ